MKNYVKWFGIIVLVVIVGFSMTACPTEVDDGDGNAVIGAKLELSEQVYTMETNRENYTITYPEYKRSLMINDNNGGNATITNGKLSYTIETPNSLETWDILQFLLFSEDYDNVTASDPNVKGFILDFYERYYSLRKLNVVYNVGATSGTSTNEYVSYVYVDKDVTITGKGKTRTSESGTSTSKTNDFSLALKTGWNAVYKKYVSDVTYPAGSPNRPSSLTSTETISLKNPALKWILVIDDED